MVDVTNRVLLVVETSACFQQYAAKCGKLSECGTQGVRIKEEG